MKMGSARCAGSGLQEEQIARASSAVQARQEEYIAMDRLRRSVQASVAIIGEAYRPLRLQYGDIPGISEPLRSAKHEAAFQAYDVAMSDAQTAWRAVKTFRARIGELPVGNYEARRPETLWTKVARHSPVRRSSAWLDSWKASTGRISNFDRIETGMNLDLVQRQPGSANSLLKPFVNNGTARCGTI